MWTCVSPKSGTLRGSYTSQLCGTQSSQTLVEDEFDSEQPATKSRAKKQSKARVTPMAISRVAIAVRRARSGRRRLVEVAEQIFARKNADHASVFDDWKSAHTTGLHLLERKL